MFSSTTVFLAGRFDFSNAFALPKGVRKSKSGSPVQAQAFGALLSRAPFPAESKQRVLPSAYGQRVVGVTSRAQKDPSNACSRKKLGLTVQWQLDCFSSCGCAGRNSIPTKSALREENLS
jgi:hypothetical protein